MEGVRCSQKQKINILVYPNSRFFSQGHSSALPPLTSCGSGEVPAGWDPLGSAVGKPERERWFRAPGTALPGRSGISGKLRSWSLLGADCVCG